MKKFYLGALGCLLAMGASAQKFDQVGTMQGEFWNLQSIPVEYAYDGKSSVYTINETESSVEYTVYNKSFAVDRTIKVDNPTSYYRTVVESREEVMIQNGEGSLEVGYRTLEEIKSGNSYLAESKSYPHWWAVNKCTNTTYTDEYVDEYVEVEGYYELVEKKEYDGGTLFVLNNTNSWYEEATGYYYFNNNKLYYAYYNTESGVLTVNEEIAEYYDFYNTQLAEFTQEDIFEYINQGPWLIVRTGNGSLDFSDYLVDSTAVEDNGNTIVFYTDISKNWSYKGLKFVWKKDIETLTAIGTSYKQSFTGEWKQGLKEDSYSEENEWLWDVEMYPFCVGELRVDMAGIYATQTLFNNDEKWEFLRPIYTESVYNTRESDRDNDGEIDYKEITYRDKVKAYEIVSEDGNVLSSFLVPEGDSYDPRIVKWDGEVYFGISVEKEISYYNYEEYTVIYSIDKNASSVKKIASTPAMRVSPALAERNSTVNVTLDAETVKNGGELIITDSNGRTISRSHVEAGQTSVPVTTDRMGSGVYNITLTEKGQKVENARIIVK